MEIDPLFTKLQINLNSSFDIFDQIESNNFNSVKQYLDQGTHPDHIIDQEKGYSPLGWMLDHDLGWFSDEKIAIARLLVQRDANLYKKITINNKQTTLIERSFDLRLHLLVNDFVKTNPNHPSFIEASQFNIVDLCKNGYHADVIVLLHLGHTNNRDEEGNTFLHHALKNWAVFPAYGNYEIFDDLICIFSADPMKENNNGETPFSIIQEYAQSNSHFKDLATKLKHLEFNE